MVQVQFVLVMQVDFCEVTGFHRSIAQFDGGFDTQNVTVSTCGF